MNKGSFFLPYIFLKKLSDFGWSSWWDLYLIIGTHVDLKTCISFCVSRPQLVLSGGPWCWQHMACAECFSVSDEKKFTIILWPQGSKLRHSLTRSSPIKWAENWTTALLGTHMKANLWSLSYRKEYATENVWLGKVASNHHPAVYMTSEKNYFTSGSQH